MTNTPRRVATLFIAASAFASACDKKPEPPRVPKMAVPAANAAEPEPQKKPSIDRFAGLYRATTDDPDLSHFLELVVADGAVRGTYTGSIDSDFTAWYQVPLEQAALEAEGALSFRLGERTLHAQKLSPKQKVDPADEGAGFARTPLQFIGKFDDKALVLTCAPADDCGVPTLRFTRVDPAGVD